MLIIELKYRLINSELEWNFSASLLSDSNTFLNTKSTDVISASLYANNPWISFGANSYPRFGGMENPVPRGAMPIQQLQSKHWFLSIPP